MTEGRSPACIYHEMNPLQKIIVGDVEGSRVPPWEPETPAVVHHAHLLDVFGRQASR